MRRLFVFIAALTFVACASRGPAGPAGAPAGALPGASADGIRLTILHTNDHHGRAWPFAIDGCEDVGGLAARATLIRQIRAEIESAGGVVLVLDAGDFDTGTPESDLFGARPDLEGMGLAGYDAAVCGNHEFDGTAARWEQQLSVAAFPLLCANVRRRVDGSLAGRAHVTFERAGLSIAVFGVVTGEALTSSAPGLWRDSYELLDPLAVGAELGPALAARHDLVVALVHMGYYEGERPAGMPAGSRAFARAVPEVDVVVDGHTHTALQAPAREGDAVIVQAGDRGRWLGRLDLLVKGDRVEVTGHALLPVNGPPVGGGPCPTERVAPAEDVVAKLADYRARVDERLSESVGRVKRTLRGGKTGRGRETNLGDVVADAMRWAVGADVAVVNAGGLRADIPAGVITRRHVLEACPFNDEVVRVVLTGAELQAVLDRSAALPAGEGGFLQVSGLRMVIRDGRAVDVLVGDAPLDPAGRYRVATSSFLHAGGDTYDELAGGAEPYRAGFVYAEAVIRYLAAFGELDGELAGRIVRE